MGLSGRRFAQRLGLIAVLWGSMGLVRPMWSALRFGALEWWLVTRIPPDGYCPVLKGPARRDPPVWPNPLFVPLHK